MTDLSGIEGARRYELHVLCDELGIHHKSSNNQNTRQLHLYKPDPWFWEFSPKNPYSSERNDSKKSQKAQHRRNKLSRKYCYECGATGLEVELFESPYMSELYCEDCLETTSDGAGGLLCDHKF